MKYNDTSRVSKKEKAIEALLVVLGEDLSDGLIEALKKLSLDNLSELEKAVANKTPQRDEGCEKSSSN